ncbi:hypothetical protein EV401DRAFT_594390 [Pisolithus croceorrhizus]|nr:hypothetical protein EV401DRAFT_594390 [Pisolithus croceorrhizus]
MTGRPSGSSTSVYLRCHAMVLAPVLQTCPKVRNWCTLPPACVLLTRFPLRQESHLVHKYRHRHGKSQKKRGYPIESLRQALSVKNDSFLTSGYCIVGEKCKISERVFAESNAIYLTLQQFVIILIAILGALSTHVKWIFNIGLADSVRRTTIFLYGVERQPRMQLLSGLPPSPRWKYD